MPVCCWAQTIQNSQTCDRGATQYLNSEELQAGFQRVVFDMLLSQVSAANRRGSTSQLQASSDEEVA